MTPHHNLNLNWLRSFEAAARLLSFTRAAHELGLTQTAVSQHIKALEQQLGEALFVRRARSLALTDMGKAYLGAVREALDKIEMSTTGLFGPAAGPGANTTITVRAGVAFIMWLSPRLGGFHQQHPDIGLKLITSIWKAPGDPQSVDVDIVLAPRDSGAPHLDLLADEQLVPVCGPQIGAIGSPRDLLQLTPIHILGFDDHWARYLSAYDLRPEMQATRLITDTSVAAIEMTSAGLGCAMIIDRFARAAVDAGRPVRIIGAPVDLGQSHCLAHTTPPAHRRRAALAFGDWLRDQF